MSESRWTFRAIFFLAFGVSVALAYVPGAKDVGQSADFDSLVSVILGVLLLSVLLLSAAFGRREFWLVAFGLVTLRTVWELAVALDDPGSSLGWATFGASVIVALALWGLRPHDAFKRHPDSTDVTSEVVRTGP